MKSKQKPFPTLGPFLCIGLLALSFGCIAQESTPERSGGGTDASDPLSKTDNTDIKWIYFQEEGGADTNLWMAYGNWNFANWGKLIYEVGYARTDDEGTVTKGFDTLSLKPLFFVGKGQVGDWKYGLATGFELVLDFAEVDSGTGTINGYGTGADLFSPLFGVSLSKGNTTLVPLVQHYIELSGDADVSVTGFRLIAIQKLKNKSWLKLDLIAPVDWNNDIVPGTVDLEWGRMLSPNFGFYLGGLVGYADSSINWGVSGNLRFVY